MRETILAATSSADSTFVGPRLPPALTGRDGPATLWKLVSTTPGITTETWMRGYFVLRSMRRLAVRLFTALLEALYIDRYGTSGTLPRKDETLIRWPWPRSWKWGMIVCIP